MRNEPVEECERQVALVGGRQSAILTPRATTGLAAALRALALPRGSGVLMPVLVCANVLYAVRGAGLRPLFADVELQDGGIGIDLQSARRAIEKVGDCRVLLAIPLFGGKVDQQDVLD